MDSSTVDARLDSIEKRLSRIETYFKLPQETPVTPNSSTTPIQPTTTTSGSGNWLAIVAVICFVLAAGFIVKLSIDSGWLTPARQIGLALVFGIVLIGAGLLLAKKDNEYASYLPAAGIIVFYLSVFAAYRLYGLITFDMALIYVGMVSAFCIWLYMEIKHDFYPIIAACGAYLSPVLLDLNADTTFAIYYFVICSLAFSIISIGLKSRLLTILSAYLAIGITALIGPELSYSNDIIIAALMANFFIFTVATFAFSIKHNQALTRDEAWAFFPVLLIFYAAEYYFTDRVTHEMAPWISLGFAAFLALLYLWGSKKFPHSDEGLNSLSMILGFATVVGFHSIYLELIPLQYRPWLFVLIMMAFGFKTPGGRASKVYLIPLAAIAIILCMEYVEILAYLLDKQFSYLSFAFAALLSLWFVIVRQNAVLHLHRGYYKILLAAAHVLAILTFYQLTHDYNTFAVSVTWLLYAVSVVVYAYENQDKLMAKSALFVLALAAGKALLYDAAAAPTVIRILCLLITGIALYGSGFLIRKIDKW